MRDNPFHTFGQLLTGQLPDEVALGPARWLIVVFFVALGIGGLAIAVYNWRRDPEQRTADHLAIFAMRFVMGGMWFEQSLWKLPFPVSGGFKYWTEQSVKGSAFQVHADIMAVFANHIAAVQPLVYLLETGVAVSLMLGLLVRGSGVLGALFILNLWIGLYNTPGEWPWTYIAIVCAQGLFAAIHAGRSLGLDNLIAKRMVPALAGEGAFVRLAHLLG